MSIDNTLSTTTTSTSAAPGGGTVFASVPPDIIHTHILTKFDPLTLASAGCVSTQLRSLCIDEELWWKICQDKWPSVGDPRVRNAISSLPFGYRSLFSNSLSFFRQCKNKSDRDRDRGSDLSAIIPDQLVSAVDMHYKGRPVYSKVQVTNTLTEGFWCGATWVNMMNPNENAAVPDRTEFGIVEDDLVSHVAQNVTLSWIMIDPTRKLAANLSSLQPVLVAPHFLNGHVWIRYSTILTTSDSSSTLSETAEIRISVTCGIQEGGEVQVKKMSMVVLDMYGENLKWKDSVVLFQESWKRENGEGREKYEKYLKRTGERRRDKEMAQVKGYKIEGIICMFFFPVALVSWVIWYSFKRYILRRRGR